MSTSDRDPKPETGQGAQFAIDDAAAGDYWASAERVHMTPNAVAVTIHRWRERYRKLVHEEIVRTVADPNEIEDELHRFFAVLEA